MRIPKRGIFYAGAFLVILYGASWMPWLILRHQYEIAHHLQDVPHADVAIVFGGLHTQGRPLSETSRERLLTGIALLQAGKADRIVVSNTTAAASEMKAFLIEQGIPESFVEMDTTAIVTEDTCIAEYNHHLTARSVLYVSHGYHLPRILYFCSRLGLKGVGIPAEQFGRVTRAEVPWYTTAHTRYERSRREAVLTLSHMMGMYNPTLKKH